MRTDALTQALGRLEGALLDAHILEAVIARREAGAARDADTGHAEALATELCRFQADDGSWHGSLARTAEALLLLHSLVPEPNLDVRAPVAAGVAWLRAQEGLPGAYGAGCDPARHDAEMCEHALSGFLSPGSPDENLAGLLLATPARFGTDADARLGISCVALQATLRWGIRGSAEDRHLASVRKVVAHGLATAVEAGALGGYVAAIAALVEADTGREVKRQTADGIAHVLRTQRADGSWPGADTFHVLDLLLRASAVGHAEEGIDKAIQRAVEMLALLQRSDGSWGRETGPERMLVGWRAFRTIR